MPDVRVREQDSVGPSAEAFDLVREVGCGVDQKALARGGIHESERRDASALARVLARFGAERLAAARVRDAAVLRDAEDDGFGAGGSGAGLRPGACRA